MNTNTEAPTCLLRKWVGKDGSERLYLNSEAIPTGVKLWVEPFKELFFRGTWILICHTDQTTTPSDRLRGIALGNELLVNSFGRDFIDFSLWVDLLEKAS